MELLKQQLGANTFTGVFCFDRSLHVLQPYTNDPALVRRGIDIATSGKYFEFAAMSKGFELQLASGGVSRFSGPMLRFFADANWNSYLGFGIYGRSIRQLLGLLSLVRGQATFAGRKTVVFLSDGLRVHPDTHTILQDVMAAANRSNVTFYSVQTTGLTTVSSAAESRYLLSQAARLSETAQQSTVNREVQPGEVLMFDIARQSIRMDRQMNLSELSEGTGGFLIANTNDVKMVRQIVEDVRTHYEISYTPANTQYDGRFRTIELKARPSLTVHTRKGYYALPLMLGSTLLPFEMATLKALGQRPLPHQFPFGADLLRFRPGGTSVQHLLAIEVPVSSLQISEKNAWLDYTALVKDGSGRVVEKISRGVPWRVAEGQRSIVFTEPLNLAPGHYTVETAVVDRRALKISANRSAVFVKPAGLSTVVFVRSFTGLRETQDIGNPLQTETGKVVPAVLGLPAGADVNLYAVVYPAMNAGATLAIVLYKDGAALAQTRHELPGPDETGAIPVFATLPAAGLPPGAYDVEVTVSQGAWTVTERAPLELRGQ